MKNGFFPWLGEHERFRFPDPALARGSVVAMGGNLSPGLLLSAYEQGLFPWGQWRGRILWQSPDPRFVIFPEKLHVSRSMEKILRQGLFEYAQDRDFDAVIRACAAAERPGQDGTWITGDIIEGFGVLHRLGYAHSAESYRAGALAGGCYGVRLGRVFFGESMFAREPNASKAAFLTFARRLFAGGAAFIDCQVPSEHLKSLGGEELSRPAFLSLLRSCLGRGAKLTTDFTGHTGKAGAGFTYPETGPL